MGGDSETVAGEKLQLPPVDDRVAAWASSVMSKFANNPRFSTVEINDERTGATVWWYGEPNAALKRELRVKLPVTTSVSATVYKAGDLRAAQKRLHASKSVDVMSVGFPSDASRLDVELNEGESNNRTSKSATERRLGKLAGAPVKIRPGQVKSAASNRQFDDYGTAGAHYHGYDGTKITNSCTTGFTVKNLNGTEGILTAAHCGPVGRQWGPRDGTRYVPYGKVSARYERYDAAVIPMATGGPFTYVGSHTSGSVTRIDGTRNPPAGAEICYSGSFSGLYCGHFVTQASTTWSIAEFATTVQGFRTERRDTLPTVGQGDSGGPGYWLTQTSTGATARYAAGIISAITGPISSGNCLGLRADRQCSPVVLSGRAWDVNGNTPWTVQRP